MATELAKAYVQILPSAKGFKENLEKELGGSGTKSGNNFANAFKAVISTAAIGKALKKTISEGMELEQNLGGTAAVFGDFAKTIQDSAAEAYKNMGISASDYMATANKMGSLFQGSGLDQQKSLNLTAQAMQRAADVASVMGLDMTSAMESIAGAAKGNFTMMDNLGVAMNATTIQAYALEKGINFDWETATNAEKAEIAMKMFFERTKQYEGNFARESKETLSGSLGSVKAAFSNVLGNLALGEDIKPSLEILINTTSVFLTENLLPTIKNIITGALDGIGNELSERIPALSFIFQNLETVIVGVTTAMVAYKAAMAISSLIDALRKATESQTISQALLNAVMNANPFVLVATLIAGLVAAVVTLWNTNEGFRNALINAWNAIKETAADVWGFVSDFFTVKIPNAFNTVINFIKENWQSLLLLITNPIAGAIKMLYDLNPKFREWVNSLFEKLKEWLGGIKEIGSNLVKGLWNGISNVTGWVLDKIRGFGQSILNGIKNIFGIHSPSTEMAWMGEMLDKGLAVGIENNTNPIKKAISDVAKMTTGTLESNLSVNAALGVSTSSAATNKLDQVIAAILTLGNEISNMKVVLDSGEFIGATTTKYNQSLGFNNALEARGVAR